MFDSERNRQHQGIQCKGIRRLQNETKKKLAVRIETLVGKSYYPNAHEYDNTKMTEIVMLTLTAILKEITIKREHLMIINSRIRHRFSKICRQVRRSRNNNEIRTNGKIKNNTRTKSRQQLHI